MIGHARYDIVRKTPRALVIRDLGPWNRHKTITNDAEWVVETLEPIREGRRLIYVDSEGQIDELVVKDGKFAGFSPGGCT